MEIFDFHSHAFTDSLAQRAVGGLSVTSGISPATDGTLSGLVRHMDECGVSKAMVLPVATKPSQQTTINNWAAEIISDRIFCCGTIHPDSEDALNEIERIASLGLYGVKFHSEYQLFLPDEERMMPIYRKIAECGLIAVFHGGWDPFGTDDVRATPERMARAAAAVPELTFVTAHLGGVKHPEDSLRYLAGKCPNVYLDCAVTARYLSDEQILALIRAHGADKVLFGSDCPWDSPANEIAMINRLPLSDEERSLIFCKNAEKLLLKIKNN